MGISLEERMKSPFFGRDWIDVSSLTKDEVEYLLDKAEQFDKWILEGDIGKYALADGLGMIMASIFYENSTRTRCSFEIGAKRLGIEVTGFSGKEGTSVEKGESLTDTVDMFHSYNMDGLIMRHDRDGAAKAVVEHLKREGGKRMPVFNGGDGKNEHPTQAVLDAAAIRQCCGRLDHLQIGIGVDALYGRTVHSLPVLLSMWPGNVFHIFTHPLLRMPNAVLRFLDAKGIEYHEYFESRDQLREMLPQLDLGYWTRPQKERFRDISEYYQAREMFVITPDLLPLLRPGFGLFHPLPDNKEFPSIHPAIHQTPFYWAKKQAGKGPTTRMTEIALSLGLLGHDFEGELFRPGKISDRFYGERASTPRAEREEDLQIRPLTNGTVIDHVEVNPYAINNIARLVGVQTKMDIYRQGVVKSRKRPDVRKGVLMIEDRYLTESEVRQVAAIAPGATINDIRDGNVVLKRDLLSPPMLEDLPFLKCTNTGCITYGEHNEHVAPKAVRVGDERSGLYKCDYCNNLMESHEMF